MELHCINAYLVMGESRFAEAALVWLCLVPSVQRFGDGEQGGLPGTPGHWEVPVALPSESCVVIIHTLGIVPQLESKFLAKKAVAAGNSTGNIGWLSAKKLYRVRRKKSGTWVQPWESDGCSERVKLRYKSATS